MNPSSEKLFHQIALTLIQGVGDITARNLLQLTGGDASQLFMLSKKELLGIAGISHKTINEIHNPEVFRKAESELNFIEKNGIQTYFITDTDYPQRLTNCADAPILLYFKGNTDFNKKKVISIVGTRNSSNYGNSFCESFIEELAKKIPDTLIISGLAYGIDIQAHRSALQHGLPTVGVLAHGLDRIYPSTHRTTAVEMLEAGGLLSEFPQKTEPIRPNFVRRNRIVAGIADAVIVVESNMRGGSLITAEIANSYCKDVFALPGRIGDLRSEGCNKLIADHKADLLLSVQYFLEQMQWDESATRKEKAPLQKELFVDLSAEEQTIVDILSGTDSIHIDALATKSEIPIYQLFSILLELEMKTIISNLPGNMYSLK